MDRKALENWKIRLFPKLQEAAGINGIDFGKYGLVIRIEKDTPQVQQQIMDVLERENPDLPYTTRVVGRVAKI